MSFFLKTLHNVKAASRKTQLFEIVCNSLTIRDFFFHSLSGEKKLSPLKSPILQINTVNFNAYIKFKGTINKISDRWRSAIKGC